MKQSTHSKYSLNQVNVKKKKQDFVEIFKNCASYINNFILNSEAREREEKKRKNLP